MKHFIDPTVDCVFKAIFGGKGNENLLVYFLNGILKPISSIVSVVVQNPYNEKEFETDKLSIVDVKAEDENEKLYQVEMQLPTNNDTYLF